MSRPRGGQRKLDEVDERLVVEMVAAGRSPREAADHFEVSPPTIRRIVERHRGGGTVAEALKEGALEHGFDLSSIDDRELGARLALMPIEAQDDPETACLWLAYGHRGVPFDEIRDWYETTIHLEMLLAEKDRAIGELLERIDHLERQEERSSVLTA